ncbi:MAG: ACP S-malonyltransferase [Dehalococcoidia bacterium]|jgi:[acyl-carrier-protein] S-malonyltransferase|nr:ACP S-malonyltransferase [Dehalococcoidia bacterium]
MPPDGAPAIRIAGLPTSSNVAWIFPGQGAQHVGMGRDLYDEAPAARAVFDAADAALGFSLTSICFEGPEDELTRTVNTQPALVTHSIAALAAAIDAGTIAEGPAFVAGHSLGEYAALIAARALTFEQGVSLVRERGRLMQEACDTTPGTMAAVLGLEPDELRSICEQHGASLCNINAPGNITIGGATTAVAAVNTAAEEAGASRIVPLDVAGAFHTPLMESAGNAMAAVLQAADFGDPAVPVISNVSATPLTSGAGLAAELTDQITRPVLWADSARAMIDGGVDTFVEFGPGRVLAGLMRRIERSATVRNIGTAADARGDDTD